LAVFQANDQAKGLNMISTDVISATALVMMVVIAALLLANYLKLQKVWHTIFNCRTTLRWARIHESENKELRSALRAEKAHVDQLQRKVTLLEEFVREGTGMS
jgi:redox-regulated HSP33 family molecular chaperone